MSAPNIQSFEDFWPYYVAAHQNPLNRALHYVGTGCALGAFSLGALTLNPLLMLAAPVLGYGPAWVGHFVVEGNRPATSQYARYSVMGDFKMLGLFLRGKMGAEVARVQATIA